MNLNLICTTNWTTDKKRKIGSADLRFFKIEKLRFSNQFSSPDLDP